MTKKGKGGTLLKERKDSKARSRNRAREAGEITRGSVRQVTESVQRLGEVMPGTARRANKKMTKSVRKHPAGWGAAAAGVAAGAVLGLAARRRSH